MLFYPHLSLVSTRICFFKSQIDKYSTDGQRQPWGSLNVNTCPSFLWRPHNLWVFPIIMGAFLFGRYKFSCSKVEAVFFFFCRFLLPLKDTGRDDKTLDVGGKKAMNSFGFSNHKHFFQSFEECWDGGGK